MDNTNGGKWRKVKCEDKMENEDAIGVLCQKTTDVTIDSKGRFKMGLSACDDGQKLIENDLHDMEKDTTCDSTKVMKVK